MDPTYTTMQGTTLGLTSSGLAMDFSAGSIAPIQYDPTTMSTPFLDAATGLNVAYQPDGTLVPVAISSDQIVAGDDPFLPPVLYRPLASGIQSLGQQIMTMLGGTSPVLTTAQPTSPLAGMSPMTLLLIGGAAYFLLRKKR